MTELILLAVIVVLVAYTGYLHIVSSKERKEFITAFLAKNLRDKSEYEKGFPKQEVAEVPPEFEPIDSENETIFDKHIKTVLNEGGESDESESTPI